MQRVHPDVQDVLCVGGLLEKAASVSALAEKYSSPSYTSQDFDKLALRI
jgi:hypothetical protein